MAPAIWELCQVGDEVGVRLAVLGREEEINSKDEDDVTGLMWALLKRHNFIVRFLMHPSLDQSRLDLNCTSVNGKTALHFAAQVLNRISHVSN